ncbi:MAG: DUF4956 domain-containing protein [Paraprevotella sp.]|nr:DUF4956 domain-containing protein [Paraprevotella sp.]
MEEFQESLLSATTFMGMPLFDLEGLQEMLVRFAINLLMIGLIVRCFYYPKSRRRDYLFTFMLMSVSIFMLIYLMEGAKLKIGAALGLFAIFGIIRYRTEAVPIREMTYLFFLVALSVINGMATKLSLVELVAANLIFIGIAWLFESNRLVQHVCSKYIRYDNINLITPEKREELIADLEKRTGLKIIRVEVGSIDFLKDSALIRIYYREPGDVGNTVGEMVKLPKNYE